MQAYVLYITSRHIVHASHTSTDLQAYVLHNSGRHLNERKQSGEVVHENMLLLLPMSYYPAAIAMLSIPFSHLLLLLAVRMTLTQKSRITQRVLLQTEVDCRIYCVTWLSSWKVSVPGRFAASGRLFFLFFFFLSQPSSGSRP